MLSILEIKKIILKLNIGVESEERSSLQDVEFNITINFHSLPKACASDGIKDAVCYAELVDAINIFCSNNKFHLLEHLSFALHEYLKNNFLNSKDELTLQACKYPLLENLKGQCCFTVKD